jgi:hypothetical protein
MRMLWVLAAAILTAGPMMLPSVCAGDGDGGWGGVGVGVGVQTVRFEFGTTLNAVLSDTLDSGRSKPGDIVKAKTSEDVRADGVVVIPRGARLVGQVTEAQTAADKTRQARLGVVFDKAELKDGRQVLLHTSFYALAAPEGESNNHGVMDGGRFGGVLGNGAAALGSVQARQEGLKPSPGAIGGLNNTGGLYASSRGVFGLDDISLEPNTAPGGGSSVILANARSVHLAGGTRLLLAVEADMKR